jgi:hypothetical protein
VEVCRRLLRGGHSARDGAVDGGVRGCGRAGGVLAWLADGRSKVSGEVEDELAVNDHVVIRLLEVAREHLWVLLACSAGLGMGQAYHHRPRRGLLPTLCGRL